MHIYLFPWCVCMNGAFAARVHMMGRQLSAAGLTVLEASFASQNLYYGARGTVSDNRGDVWVGEEGEREEGPSPEVERFGRTLVLAMSSGLTVAAVGLKPSQPLDCLLLPGEPPGRAC